MFFSCTAINNKSIEDSISKIAMISIVSDLIGGKVVNTFSYVAIGSNKIAF